MDGEKGEGMRTRLEDQQQTEPRASEETHRGGGVGVHQLGFLRGAQVQDGLDLGTAGWERKHNLRSFFRLPAG